MTPDRAALVKAQASLGEASNDLQGALTLYARRDPVSRSDYAGYLRHFETELEAAASALGFRLVPADTGPAQVIVEAVIDGLGLERVA